ncbi:hypothetical protein ACJJTC_011644 [Scirpophaga incertulas]
MTKDLSTLDFSKIAALQQKRTLAFVNHFVTTTVKFLNNFSKQCEQKLMLFERKLEKVEAALILLETRLSSIPEVNTDENKVESNENIQQEAEHIDSSAQKRVPDGKNQQMLKKKLFCLIQNTRDL